MSESELNFKLLYEKTLSENELLKQQNKDLSEHLKKFRYNI